MLTSPGAFFGGSGVVYGTSTPTGIAMYGLIFTTVSHNGNPLVSSDFISPGMQTYALDLRLTPTSPTLFTVEVRNYVNSVLMRTHTRLNTLASEVSTLVFRFGTSETNGTKGVVKQAMFT